MKLISRLLGNVLYGRASNETLVRQMMLKALKRILSGLKKETRSEEYQDSLINLRTLMDGPRGAFTVDAVLRLMIKVNESGILQDEYQQFDNVFIVVTVLPPVARSELRLLFPGGYTRYLESFDIGRMEKGQAFANWIVCLKDLSIHLQYFSPAVKGKPLVVFAKDLLEPYERAKYLGADPWFH